MRYLTRWFILGIFSLTGCEMDSVSLVSPESLLIAEVYIAKDGTSYLNFYIDRKTAIGIAEHLIDAEQRVNFLNEKLKNINK